jgi:PTH1 family peptidyl-tRNA hydrolase
LRLVLGLGNPGPRYRRTRHNLGFMVVEALAARWGGRAGRTEHEAFVVEAERNGEPVLLARPLTFMNRSGLAAERLLSFTGLAAGEMLVVVDDFSLDLGLVRVREKGSHGGHNGLRSIIETLGSDEFPRIRVGIRAGEVPEDLAEFVLSEFSEDEILTVQEMVGAGADAVETFLADGAAVTMNRFNSPRKA